MSDSLDPARPDGPAWDRIDGDGPDLASALTALVDWLVDRDRYRISDCRVLEDLYHGRWVTSDDLLPGVMAYAEAGGDPVKLNFARNAVDFVHTKVAAETPAVVATAKGGGYSQEQRADRLTRYLDTLWDSADVEAACSNAALHALRTGTAAVKTHGAGGRPSLELVPAEWVHVDPTEAATGSPRSLYERRPVSRRYLLERFVGESLGDEEASDLEVAIRGLPNSRDPLSLGADASGPSSAADLVDVYEGWTLPEDLPDAAPGLHVIAVMGAVLLREEWTLPRFPHAFLHVDPPPVGRGFWAQGLLGQLDEAQAEVDFLLQQVSDQIRASRLKVFIAAEDQSLKDDHLVDSRQGTLVRYDAAFGPPVFSTPPTVSREALEHIQWLVSEMYNVAGMSEQAASSQRPAGINSGRGILFFHDFQTRRFVDLVQRYGRFVVDLAERMLDRAEELRLSEDESEATDDDVSWTDVRMDRRDFALTLEEVSPVPRTYAGRMQRIEQLIAQGQVPPGFWAQYLSNPDAWKAEHRAASQADFLDWVLKELADVDAEMPPLSDKMDFDLAIEVLTGETLTLIRKKADQAVVDRVEDYYDMLVQRRKELQPQQPNPAAGTPTAPGLQKMATGGVGPTEPSAG